MRTINIIYHYYPQFRAPIFEEMVQRNKKIHFIYGRNARYGVANKCDKKHELRRNFFWRDFIFQSIGVATIWRVCRNDSIILGDIKFANSWLYAVIGRLFGRKVWFWTHGVLESESGLKWKIRQCYYKLSHGLMLYSSHEAQLLKNLGYDKKLIVIGNTNYTKREAVTDSGLELRESGNGICYIGRISIEKGVNQFIEFARHHPDQRVVLVGPVVRGGMLPSMLPENLILHPPEYTLSRLSEASEGCDTLVMFSPAGLSLFTGILLAKRLLIKELLPQKPEYHLLKQYGLVETFDSYAELENELNKADFSWPIYYNKRKQFLDENSAEKVAEKVINAMSHEQGIVT